MGRSADRRDEASRAAGEAAAIHVSSRLLGELDVPAERVLHLPDGLAGFPDRCRFVRVPLSPASPFESLVSIDDPDLAFSVADPSRLVPGYVPPLDEAALLLQAPPQDVGFLALLVLPEDVRDATIDLAAPIAIDLRRRYGRQILVAEPSVAGAVRVFRAGR